MKQMNLSLQQALFFQAFLVFLQGLNAAPEDFIPVGWKIVISSLAGAIQVIVTALASLSNPKYGANVAEKEQTPEVNKTEAPRTEDIAARGPSGEDRK